MALKIEQYISMHLFSQLAIKLPT